ncbi:MAG: hypothetical protein ACK5A0_04690 [Polaromonas sp.]
MGGAAIAFLSGLGTGLIQSKEKADKQAREDEDRALRNKAAQLQINAAERAAADQATLADAGKPLAVTQGSQVSGPNGKEFYSNPADAAAANARYKADAEAFGPDAGALGAPVGDAPIAASGITGRAKGNQITTEPVDIAKLNSPEARSQRVIAALSGIDPIKALDLENQQTTRAREGTKFTQEQEAYAKKLKDEGAIDALKALSSGDGVGMVAAFNKGGDFKIEGEPVIKTESRTIPGVGTIPTYTATFNIKGKDGIVKPMTVNSHDARMSLMPYEKAMELGLKGKEVDSKGELRVAQAENMMLRAGIAASRGAGVGKEAPAAEPFNPLANFDSKKAQAEAFAQASKLAVESAATGKPMTPAEQGKLAQQIYRSTEDAFATENTNRFQKQTVGNELRTVASDPAAYASAYDKALKLGMDTKTLASMGFAAPAAAAAPVVATKPAPAPAPAQVSGPATPQPPGPKPERAASEGLQAYKQRLVAWDQNRMAYEDVTKEAAIRAQNETLRQQAVAARPALAQMGTGLR